MKKKYLTPTNIVIAVIAVIAIYFFFLKKKPSEEQPKNEQPRGEQPRGDGQLDFHFEPQEPIIPIQPRLVDRQPVVQMPTLQTDNLKE